MLHALARNWWLLLIRGIAAVLFGILAFVWPGATIFAIVVVFGAYAFVDGVFAIAAAVRAATAHQRWWPMLFEGIVGLAIGVITFFEPNVTAIALYYTIAIWAFITGVLEIAAALQLRKVIANEIWLIVAGVVSILFAGVMIWHPLAGVQALIWLVGFYAVVFGVMMIALSLRLRGHAAEAA